MRASISSSADRLLPKISKDAVHTKIGTLNNHIEKERGGDNVHIKNPQTNHHELRPLINRREVLTRVGQHFSSASITSEHVSVVANALHLNLALFRGKPLSTHPLWIKLLSADRSLRLVSPQWREDADTFLSKFGFTIHSKLLGDQQAMALRYRLGDTAGLMSQAAPLDYAKYLLRAGQPWSEVQRMQRWNVTQKASLLGIALVESKRRGDLSPALLSDAENIEIKLLSQDYSDLDSNLTLIHLSNSINFALLDIQNIPEIERRLDLASKTVSKIGHVECRQHVEGIFAYHLSAVRRIQSRFSDELELLLKARLLDKGFCDYDYRIASILHDKGDKRARKFYESALKTSCFPASYVNDYGCFLSDINDHQSLASWENVARGLT